MDDLTHLNSSPLPFPLQHALTQTVASPASAQERLERMTLWAGQSAAINRCTEVNEFMKKLLADVDACFSRLGNPDVTDTTVE
jgi:hypothetical protein